MLKGLDRVVTWLEDALLLVAVACLVAIAAMVLMVVLERRDIGPGVPDDVIVLQQTMVVAVGCSLAYITRLNGHISIDLTYNLFGRRMRRVADFVALLVGLVAAAPIAYWAWRNFIKSVESGSYYFGEIDLPEWPAKLFFFIAFFTITLRLVLMLVGFFLAPPRLDDAAPPVEAS